ncbi:MAG: DNA mismatch repair endonuclease MutL [Succinivibrionaceae bacterium]|nr:DNA mismatch repair endonuclease MutL [Succinivibrionaceae bacterium]
MTEVTVTIRLLPPILANQIAAGEVVERPASVVKELVENSLDAGATKIEVDIVQGGAKLIRVRDNGSGIPREELPLALRRHATSKISTADDLNAITTMGFRGEALASASAVSRLTLTSRTEGQKEAWQVFAEGSEQEAVIKPASHPVGTTVEVKDLFFNVPARRRFLKSEKTEFSRILQTVSHLALSRFDFEITLRRDGRLVKTVKVPGSPDEDIIRVGAVVGGTFAEEALRVSLESGGTELTGWVMMPEPGSGSVPDEYFFVNGRSVRDRLLMHAVRQAATEITGRNEVPSYVLYLRIDPHDVDVNVHPTKHEVRFAEAREVHDLVVTGVRSALAEVYGQGSVLPEADEGGYVPPEIKFREKREEQDLFTQGSGSDSPAPEALTAGEAPGGAPETSPSGDAPAKMDESSSGEDNECSSFLSLRVSAGGAGSGSGSGGGTFGSGGGSRAGVRQFQSGGGRQLSRSEMERYARSYEELYRARLPGEGDEAAAGSQGEGTSPAPEAEGAQTEYRLIRIVDGHTGVFAGKSDLYLLDLPHAFRKMTEKGILEGSELRALSPAPLIMPVSVKTTEKNVSWAAGHEEFLKRLGFSLRVRGSSVQFNAVPLTLRTTVVADTCLRLITDAAERGLSDAPDEKFAELFADMASEGKRFTPQEALRLSELCPYLMERLPADFLDEAVRKHTGESS